MLFLISKLFGALLDPLLWIIAAFFGSWLASNPKLKNGFRFGSFIILITFSNPFLSNWALTKLEYPAISKDEIPLVETAVVLGGILQSSENSVSDQFQLSESSDRLIETLRLYNDKIVRRIILSGGSGRLIAVGKPESLLLEELSFDLIKKPNIIIDTLSRNTHENAINTAKVLLEIDRMDQPILLVTSAFHMKRSIQCFQKQGIAVIPYPVDIRGDSAPFNLGLLIPSSDSLVTWKILFKEVIGLYAYQILGYA